MYKHTLLIYNGFGSRQRLLSVLKGFRAALERPFNHLLHTGFHHAPLSGMLPESLLFFLNGFVRLTLAQQCNNVKQNFLKIRLKIIVHPRLRKNTGTANSASLRLRSA